MSLGLSGAVHEGTAPRRGVAKLLRENIAFKWIIGNTQIDFRTLNNFRLRLEDKIKDIFRQVLHVALNKGMIKGKDIFIDHLKFEANANRHKILTGAPFIGFNFLFSADKLLPQAKGAVHP